MKKSVSAATGVPHHDMGLQLEVEGASHEAAVRVELREATNKISVGQQGVTHGCRMVVTAVQHGWERSVDGRLYLAAREGDVFTVRVSTAPPRGAWCR